MKNYPIRFIVNIFTTAGYWKQNRQGYLANKCTKFAETISLFAVLVHIYESDTGRFHTISRLVARQLWQLQCERRKPPNSSDFNPLDYFVTNIWWRKKPSPTAERRNTLRKLWNDLPRKSVTKAVQSFRKHLRRQHWKTLRTFHFMWYIQYRFSDRSFASEQLFNEVPVTCQQVCFLPVSLRLLVLKILHKYNCQHRRLKSY